MPKHNLDKLVDAGAEVSLALQADRAELADLEGVAKQRCHNQNAALLKRIEARQGELMACQGKITEALREAEKQTHTSVKGNAAGFEIKRRFSWKKDLIRVLLGETLFEKFFPRAGDTKEILKFASERGADYVAKVEACASIGVTEEFFIKPKA